MPVFLRAFPLKDDSASVAKPRRPAERLREVRWQEDQTLDRVVLIVADFGDGSAFGALWTHAPQQKTGRGRYRDHCQWDFLIGLSCFE
jgi:hypothetical protein